MVWVWTCLRIAGKAFAWFSVVSLPLIPFSFWSLTATSPVWLTFFAQWLRDLLGVGPEFQFWWTVAGAVLKIAFGTTGILKMVSVVRRWSTWS